MLILLEENQFFLDPRIQVLGVKFIKGVIVNIELNSTAWFRNIYRKYKVMSY